MAQNTILERATALAALVAQGPLVASGPYKGDKIPKAERQATLLACCVEREALHLLGSTDPEVLKVLWKLDSLDGREKWQGNFNAKRFTPNRPVNPAWQEWWDCRPSNPAALRPTFPVDLFWQKEGAIKNARIAYNERYGDGDGPSLTALLAEVASKFPSRGF